MSEHPDSLPENESIEETCEAGTPALQELDTPEEIPAAGFQIDTAPGIGNRTVNARLTGDEFEKNTQGVYWNDKSNAKKVSICGPLRIVCLARDGEQKNWSTLVVIEDQDGQGHVLVLRMEDIDGEALIKTLRSMGLTVSPDRRAKEKLMVYLQDCPPECEERIRTTSRTGWHDGCYVFSDGRSFGQGTEHYMYQQAGFGEQHATSRGTLKEWQENVARLCSGNSRLLLAVSMAFASVLLKLFKAEGGGINLVGNSSTGKSTALHVASSVYGEPAKYIQSWRSTSNALELTAKQHNDALLILDELGEIEPKEAGAAAYMLANGQTKGRMKSSIELRERSRWTLFVLSAGEVTVAEHMSEGGKRARAGQEIRLADIPADACAGWGLFENLHGCMNGATYSDMIKGNAARYHGAALPAFLHKLIADKELAQTGYNVISKYFFEKFVPKGASGQVYRLAHRFVLIALGGELATRFGITGWEKHEALDAVGRCFTDWLNKRGGSEAQEVTSLMRQVQAFFEAHGSSRFEPIDKTNGFERVIHNRAGYSKNTSNGLEYWVLPEAFGEICKGFSKEFAGKVLTQKGFIRTGADGKPQSPQRLPGIGKKRVYVFTSRVLADAENPWGGKGGEGDNR